MEVVLNSSWVIEKKPTVSKQIVHRRDDGADGELPLEAEPEIAEHGDDREHDAEACRIGRVRPTPSGRRRRSGGSCNHCTDRLLAPVRRRLPARNRPRAAGRTESPHPPLSPMTLNPDGADVHRLRRLAQLREIGVAGGSARTSIIVPPAKSMP